MSPLRLLLSVMLLVPLIFSGPSCVTREVKVPVYPAPLKCPLPERSLPPSLTPGTAGDLVTIPKDQAVSLAVWIAEITRWSELAQVCLDTADAPMPSKPSNTKAEIEAPIFVMSVPGVKVTVAWEACGEVNAYYYPGRGHIELCNELVSLSLPAAQFIVAHEMAHAIITQRGIPYTGLHEAAADELAMIAIFAMHGPDWDDWLLAVADFWAEEDYYNPRGLHPSNLQRHWAVQRFRLDHSTRLRIIKTWFNLLEITKPK